MPRGGSRPTCVIDGCGMPNKAKGLCVNHYMNFKRTGDPCSQKRAPNGAGTVTNGYRMIFHNGKQIREHRYVAEQMLGRALLPNEVVHHIDGNTLNNDPSNLQVLDSQSVHMKMHHGTLANHMAGVPDRPRSQRVEDKVKWAKEILALHDKD
jgi:HNH endonuclease